MMKHTLLTILSSCALAASAFAQDADPERVVLPDGTVIERSDPLGGVTARGEDITDEGALERSMMADPETRAAIEETMRMLQSDEVEAEFARREGYGDMTLEELDRELEGELGADDGAVTAKREETRQLLEIYDTPERMAQAEAANDSMERIVADMDVLAAEVEAIVEARRDLTPAEEAEFKARSAALEKRMIAVMSSLGP